jgi:hypothetical protein
MARVEPDCAATARCSGLGGDGWSRSGRFRSRSGRIGHGLVDLVTVWSTQGVCRRRTGTSISCVLPAAQRHLACAALLDLCVAVSWRFASDDVVTRVALESCCEAGAGYGPQCGKGWEEEPSCTLQHAGRRTRSLHPNS